MSMVKGQVLIFLGPPLSGKGTQGKRFAERNNMCFISPGDIFRQEISNRTQLGLKVMDYVNSGRLVPDPIVNKIVLKHIERQDCPNGLVLDGYPRTIRQADFLKKSQLNHNISSVIILLIDKEESLKRAIIREKHEHRIDDQTNDVIDIRWNEYSSKTVPVIKFYEKKNIIVYVEGMGTIHDVEMKIFNILLEKHLSIGREN
jgi:adenylate kinase